MYRTHMELRTGVNGSGHTLYMAVTVRFDGSWKWVERFTDKAECLNWIKWA